MTKHEEGNIHAREQSINHFSIKKRSVESITFFISSYFFYRRDNDDDAL